MKEEIYVGRRQITLEIYIVKTFDFSLLWEFLSSLLHSIKDRGVKIVELSDHYWNFMRAMTLEAAISVHQ